ncbi:hypothetical protein, partial [Shewanella sp. YLB-07]|uniref:hypothetical protein n=1 Tax=Shewanella sp. YLB-07 TaxID=2601268 RepID=UPI001D13564B
AGFSIAFTATATLSDNTTYVAIQDGSEVNWTIFYQSGSGATIDANTGVLTTGVDSVGDITVRATGTSTAWSDTADKTITVTNATVTSVAVTSDIDSVAAGFSIDFTATATLSDGTTHTGLEDGSEEDWTIVSQPGTGATIDTKTGVLTTGVDSVGEITVQVKGTSTAWSDTADKTITVTDATVTSVVVTSNTDSVAAGFSIAFTATATLSDNTTYVAIQDGSEVNWTIFYQSGSGANIDTNTGVLTTGVDSVGDITVRATGTSTAWSDTADKTITVTNATVTSVAVTSNTDSVAAGFSIAFTATATLSDNTTYVAIQDGSEVNWTIFYQSGSGANIDTNTGVLTTGVDSVGEITVRATGTSTAWSDTADKTITVTNATVTSVAVTSNTDSVVAGFSIDFTATATLSDSTTYVATQDGSEVNWTIFSQSGSGATIDTNTGVLSTTADSVGDITVRSTGTSAAWDKTADKTIIVTEFELLMCGAVNDNDPTNAAGDCLKVATDGATGMLFTSTPSLVVMDALGYQEAAGSANINGGKTYAEIIIENGTYGLVGSFARFDQILIGGDNTSSTSVGGVSGQYDRWCKNLSDMNFNGRADWRRASLAELEGLYSDRGGMDIGYGWPAGMSSYWSSTGTWYTFYYITLGGSGGVHDYAPSWPFYASCVSAP